MKLKTLKPRLQVAKPKLGTLAALPTQAAGSWRTSDMTASQRGYGYKWTQARAGYLTKHPLCAYCAKTGMVTAASVVDHIIPHRGDMVLFWDSDNWQSLCAPCHSSVKQKEEHDKSY